MSDCFFKYTHIRFESKARKRYFHNQELFVGFVLSTSGIIDVIHNGNPANVVCFGSRWYAQNKPLCYQYLCSQ